MLYYFDINTCIITTISAVSKTLTRRATLRLQLVYIYYFYISLWSVSYTHLRAHETRGNLVCRLLLEKKKFTIATVTEKGSIFGPEIGSILAKIQHFWSFKVSKFGHKLCCECSCAINQKKNWKSLIRHW